MMENVYQVTIENEGKRFPQGTTYLDIARTYQSAYDNDIVLVFADGKLQELYKQVEKDCRLAFVTTADAPGNRTYKRGISFLLMKAVYDVAGAENVKKVWIRFSLDKGFYCTVEGSVQVTQEFLNQVDAKMRDLVAQDIPIKKRKVSTDEAVALFKSYGMVEKERLFHYRRSSTVNIYSIGGFEDYYYGYMVPSTGYLKHFQLYLYDEGFVVQMPEAANPNVVPEFAPKHKLFQVLKESTGGASKMGVDTIGDLNDYVTRRNPQEQILVQEALQEKRIAEIAAQIAADPEKKFVLIAGPSSSGKTTFSHRLSIQLRVNGLVPHPIAVDNYFVNREDTPLDEEGKINYELSLIHI